MRRFGLGAVLAEVALEDLRRRPGDEISPPPTRSSDPHLVRPLPDGSEGARDVGNQPKAPSASCKKRGTWPRPTTAGLSWPRDPPSANTKQKTSNTVQTLTSVM